MEFSTLNTLVSICDNSRVKFMGVLDTDWITGTNWRHVSLSPGLCPHLLTRAGLVWALKVHQVFHTYNDTNTYVITMNTNTYDIYWSNNSDIIYFFFSMNNIMT